jgi:hypothetical protein
MSANLHVVLSYNSFLSQLIAEFYNQNNIANSALPVPFTIVATYRFFRNGIFISEIVNGDRVVLPITTPICSDGYSVFVTYTANGIVQPASSDSIVIGTNLIYGSFISQTTIPGGVSLNLVPPTGIIPTGIQWARNYQLLSPQPINPLHFIAPGNGIYEVRFQSLITGLTYIAAVEVTQSSPATYIKTIGNDGNLYGLFGTPQNVTSLLFFPIDANAPYRSKIYVNGILISDNSFLTTSRLVAGDLINVFITDCCDIVLSATTFILPCGPVPLTSATKADTKSYSVPSNIKSYAKPTNSNAPQNICGCRK